MKTTPVFIRVILLALVFTGIGVWAWRSFGPSQNPPADGPPTGVGISESAPAVDAPAHQILVTYFTTDQRCPTCLKIEKQTKEAMHTAFADQLASGDVKFQTTNFDRAENKHFIEDYELSFKTVVISDRRDGEEAAWSKFDDVWELVGEPDEFATYLQDGVRKYLKNDSDA